MTEQGRIYINGNWQAGDGTAFKSICPATGETIWSGNAASVHQVHDAVFNASRAFNGWALESLEKRVDIIRKYGELLAANKDEIAALISREMGKPLWESLTEVGAMIGKVEISITSQAERAGSEQNNTAFGQSLLAHRPHGVLAVFGPFNFPGHLPGGHLIPALLAGNVIVFKPSELTPAVGEKIVRLFEKAGLPAGCLNLVQGAREIGQALLNQDISGVLFTGSARTGIAFHQHFAGRPEVLLALEMGGNNPLIVTPPVKDIEAASDLIIMSAFITTGQRCSCARRLVVPSDKFGDKIIDSVVEKMKKLPIGAWNEENQFMGPVVNAASAQAAVDFVSNLRAKGADEIVPLEKVEGRSEAFVRPGLYDVTDADGIADEELFAPLLQVQRYKDLDQAIQFANDTRFGLAGGLICDDEDLWQKVHSTLRSGILNWNRPTTGAASSQPFGGPGISGNLRPSAYYAADYCAWPQASQISVRAEKQAIPGLK